MTIRLKILSRRCTEKAWCVLLPTKLDAPFYLPRSVVNNVLTMPSQDPDVLEGTFNIQEWFIAKSAELRPFL